MVGRLRWWRNSPKHTKGVASLSVFPRMVSFLSKKFWGRHEKASNRNEIKERNHVNCIQINSRMQLSTNLCKPSKNHDSFEIHFCKEFFSYKFLKFTENVINTNWLVDNSRARQFLYLTHTTLFSMRFSCDSIASFSLFMVS